MLLFTQDVGSPELWAQNAGIDGLVLMVLCLVMISLFGLLVWIVRKIVAGFQDSTDKFAQSINALSKEMSQNTLEVTKPLTQVSLQQIQVANQVDAVEKKIDGLIEEVRQMLKEEAIERNNLINRVQTTLTDVSTRLDIVDATLKGIYNNSIK